MEKTMYPLETIGKAMKQEYFNCSDIAADYLIDNGVEGLDDPSVFTDDESKSLAMVSVVVWQTLAAALRTEGFEPKDDERTFDAVMDQIKTHHFG